MIDAQLWYKSLDLAAVVTIVMGAAAVILFKFSQKSPKHKTHLKR